MIATGISHDFLSSPCPLTPILFLTLMNSKTVPRYESAGMIVAAENRVVSALVDLESPKTIRMGTAEAAAVAQDGPPVGFGAWLNERCPGRRPSRPIA